MAAHSGARSATGTLGAGVADTFDLTAGGFERFEIIHHGDVDDVVYFRTDGTAAAVAADENRLLLPRERLTVPAGGGGDFRQVSAISAGAATVTVEAL